jgi:hypothetical protein
MTGSGYGWADLLSKEDFGSIVFFIKEFYALIAAIRLTISGGFTPLENRVFCEYT